MVLAFMMLPFAVSEPLRVVANRPALTLRPNGLSGPTRYWMPGMFIRFPPHRWAEVSLEPQANSALVGGASTEGKTVPGTLHSAPPQHCGWPRRVHLHQADRWRAARDGAEHPQ